MQDERRELSPIRKEDIDAEMVTRATEIYGLLSKIRAKLGPTRIDPLFAERVLGSAKKQIPGPDGEITEVDWTQDEFMEGFRAAKERDARGNQEDMIEEVSLAMSAHHILTYGSDQSLATDARNVIDFSDALLQRLRVAPFDVAEVYTFDPTPLHYEFDLLEAVRRTALRPSYIVHEGMGRSGVHVGGFDEYGFWDQLSERQEQIRTKMKNPDDEDEFFRLRDAQIEENLESYTSEDWAEILREESSFYVQHVRYLASHAKHDAEASLNWARRLTHGGIRVASDEEVAYSEQNATELAEIEKQIAEFKDLESVSLWVKQKFGEEATFLTLLQLLYPVSGVGDSNQNEAKIQ